MNKQKSKTVDNCCRRLAWSEIDEVYLKTLISLAKDEDIVGAGLAAGTSTPGDHSSALLKSDQNTKVVLRAREPLALCGEKLAPTILQAYGSSLSYQPLSGDGDSIEKGQAIATITGPAQAILSAERPMLNFMQMLSGVATQTQRYVNALGGTTTRLLDTRKTTPAYRVLEKYAVASGGGWNHRIGLFDRVMLKDNHIAAFGNEPMQATIDAVSESRRRAPNLLVEMEVDSLEQIEIALAANVDIILLDNFNPTALQLAVAKIGDQAVTEASGGITLETLPKIANLGLDFISTGALVHQSRWVDIGLDWS